jgi:hypothetical protein
LFSGNDVRKCRAVGGLEEYGQNSGENRDRIKLRHRHRVESQRNRHGDRNNGAAELAPDHRSFAIPAIHKRAGGKARDQIRRGADSQNCSGLRCRAGDRQHDERKGQIL